MAVTVDATYLSNVIRPAEYAALAPQVKAAHEQLHAGTGLGSDFLGWMNLPFEYNKEEEDRKLYQAGVEQGIEQGIEQTKKKMACSLLKDNIPLEKVAKLLEVKVSDIEKWKPDMK